MHLAVAATLWYVIICLVHDQLWCGVSYQTLCMHEIYINPLIHACIYVYMSQAMAVQSHNCNCTCTHVTDCVLLTCYIYPLLSCIVWTVYDRCISHMDQSHADFRKSMHQKHPKVLECEWVPTYICLSLPSHIYLHMHLTHGRYGYTMQVCVWSDSLPSTSSMHAVFYKTCDAAGAGYVREMDRHVWGTTGSGSSSQLVGKGNHGNQREP